jgi:hypothetical protein
MPSVALAPRGQQESGIGRWLVSLAVSELAARAALHVHTSEPLFIIGSTLAYIGRLQRCFTGITADSPEEAQKIRTALEKIKLPSQYQYRRR